jgi:hypothetical protein
LSVIVSPSNMLNLPWVRFVQFQQVQTVLCGHINTVSILLLQLHHRNWHPRYISDNLATVDSNVIWSHFKRSNRAFSSIGLKPLFLIFSTKFKYQIYKLRKKKVICPNGQPCKNIDFCVAKNTTIWAH